MYSNQGEDLASDIAATEVSNDSVTQELRKEYEQGREKLQWLYY